MNEDDLEIRGLGPLNEADLARLEAQGAHYEETGECIFAELEAEMQIEKLTADLGRCRRVIAAAKNPADEQLTRGRGIVAGLEAELSAYRRSYLKACSLDRSKPN